MLSARGIRITQLVLNNAKKSFHHQSLALKWGVGEELSNRAINKKLSNSIPEDVAANHAWRQTNHIWTDEELSTICAEKHHPKSVSDWVARSIMTGLYHGFNFVTGFNPANPSVNSVAWRLIILESVAGVPGFIAAGFRHFYSLRTLQRDHGQIFTFLEEAENERMHLLVCLKMFNASAVTRAMVVGAQFTMGPILTLTYFIHPRFVHRFVGYLEETAVQTYTTLIDCARTPGLDLHEAWKDLPAPGIAKSYWHLKDDATWVDALEHMRADEAHHRDVNHTFASLPRDAENPFIEDHMRDFDRAAQEHMKHFHPEDLIKK